MSHKDLLQLLADAGFETGWALLGETLTVWEHDTDPPAPLTRPTETTNEATTADANTGTDPE
jgi:hypothetical protein